MRTYDYLIAYHFSAEGYLTPCEGTMHLSLTRKIRTFDDINELRNAIEKSIEGASNLSIYNFILLGRNKH